MRSYESLNMESLCDRICENKKTLIVFHARPDADAIGSAFALRELLNSMGIPAVCACADEIPERLRFLTDGVQGSVLLDDDMALDHERVITVDSAAPEQLGTLFARLHRDIELMIDHHEVGMPYADYYIDSGAAATGEILYRLARMLEERGRIAQIPHRALRAIYAAISSDTGGFRYANVTPDTFRIAAELLEAGVEGDEIARLLYDSKSLKQVRAEGEAARRLSVHEKGRIASVTFPYSSKYSLGLSDEHLETIIDIPRSISGVEVAIAVKQPTQENVFRASLRSVGDVDVSAVCAKFGGGGHKRAAGCPLKADGIDDAEKMLLQAVKEVL